MILQDYSHCANRVSSVFSLLLGLSYLISESRHTYALSHNIKLQESSTKSWVYTPTPQATF